MYRDLIRGVLERASVTRLKPTHEGFTCCCPFHEDSSASFAISESGLYICYSAKCGARGNLYSLLTELGGYSSKAALELMQDTPVRYDVDRMQVVPRYEDRRRVNAVSQPVTPALVAAYSAYCPTYMLKRGFREGLLSRFDIGYDKAKHQVVIPVHDHEGRLAGVIRRQTNPNMLPKYLIDLPSGERGGLVFNLWRVPARYRRVIIVEGALDCLWMVQNGHPNTVALLGTSLSKIQYRLLGKRFDEFVLMLDKDDSGRAGTAAALPRLRTFGSVYVAGKFPRGKDPQDNDRDGIQQALDGARVGHLWFRRIGYRYVRKQKDSARP